MSVTFQVSLLFPWGRVAGRDLVPLLQTRKLGEVVWPRPCHTWGTCRGWLLRKPQPHHEEFGLWSQSALGSQPRLLTV